MSVKLVRDAQIGLICKLCSSVYTNVLQSGFPTENRLPVSFVLLSRCVFFSFLSILLAFNLLIVLVAMFDLTTELKLSEPNFREHGTRAAVL
jgi:hypothetical protein